MRALLLALALVPLVAQASPHRSHAEVMQFKRLHPCPATGQARGPCPGYVVDHIQPLCAGGADAPRNMQWQTVADGKVKDRAERRECRALRR